LDNVCYMKALIDVVFDGVISVQIMAVPFGGGKVAIARDMDWVIVCKWDLRIWQGLHL